jgi:hypothetical protein
MEGRRARSCGVGCSGSGAGRHALSGHKERSSDKGVVAVTVPFVVEVNVVVVVQRLERTTADGIAGESRRMGRRREERETFCIDDDRSNGMGEENQPSAGFSPMQIPRPD